MVDELLFSCFVCSYRTGPAVSGFVYNVVVFCFPSSLTRLDPGTVATLLGGTFVFVGRVSSRTRPVAFVCKACWTGASSSLTGLDLHELVQAC